MYMSGIARANVDYASTHTKDDTTHSASAETKYVSPSGATVFIGGNSVITRGDTAACGDIAVGASTSVFVGGKGVHRLGDSLDSHSGSYSPSVCASASDNVFAG